MPASAQFIEILKIIDNFGIERTNIIDKVAMVLNLIWQIAIGKHVYKFVKHFACNYKEHQYIPLWAFVFRVYPRIATDINS